MTLPRYTGVTVQTTTNAPAPAATVTVNLHNTSVPADLFSDEAGATPLANPLTSDAVTGLFTFCVANGLYDITVTGLTVTPYTIPGVQLVYLQPPVGQFFSASVTLTHADILALPVTPFSVVAAQGNGTRVRLLGADCVVDTTAGAYTNIDPAAFGYFQYAGGQQVGSLLANDATLTPPRAYFTTAFGSAGKTAWWFENWVDAVQTSQWGNLSLPLPVSVMENAALQFTVNNAALGALTGGDPTNTLAVTVAYLIL